MAVRTGTSPEAPRTDTTRAIKRAMRAAELAPASWPSQLVAYGEVVLAIGLACALTDNIGVLVATAGALGVGILIGVLTPIGGWFTDVSGTVAAVLAMCFAFVLLAFTDGRVGGESWMVPVIVGLTVLGLDWRFAPRLRARAVCSGALVVPLLGLDRDGAYAGAIAWFLGLLVTLWLLERDVRRAAMRPVPLDGFTPQVRTNVADLLRTAGIGLGIGLVAVFLLGDTTCSLRQDEAVTSNLPFSAGNSTGGGSEPSSSLSQASPELQDLDVVGLPRAYSVDQDGRTYFRDSDGDRIYVEEQGGRTVLRNGDGDILAEVDERGIRVYDEDGREVGEYLRDPSGDISSGSSGEPGSNSATNQRSGSTSGSGRGSESADDSSDVPWLAMLGGLVAVVAVVLLVLLLRRRSDRPLAEPSWAERLAARLDDEGRRRGRGRGRGETVVDHATALAHGPLPDARVATVGQVLSAALFGPSAPPTRTQTWAENVVNEVSDANPPPTRGTRGSRRRSRRAKG